MRLYLIRHGKAERHASDGEDAARVLTKRGRHQAQWLAERLAEAGPDGPARMLTSPAARAMQTARIIAEGLDLAPETEPAISLDAAASAVVQLVARMGPADRIALVGHNPTLSMAAELILHGVGRSAGLDLRTGQAAVIDLADPASPLGGGSLVELLRMPEEDGG